MLTRIAALGFAGTVVWLHFVRRDISPAERGISRYAEGRTLVATTIAFLALAAALGLTAWSLHSWLFAIAGVSMIAVAATPKPRESRTLTGAIHTVAGFAFFITAASAARSWSPHQPRSTVSWFLWTVMFMFISAAAGIRGLREAAGYYQRLAFALLVIWLLLPA